jgi:hypothetical protein
MDNQDLPLQLDALILNIMTIKFFQENIHIVSYFYPIPCNIIHPPNIRTKNTTAKIKLTRKFL